jgi:tetratricopeptide (TPR) repeat protein
MNDAQIRRAAEEGKVLMAREQAKKLVAEGKAMLERDLRGGLLKLRQAQAFDPDYPDLEDEIFLREDAIEKLDSLLDYIVVLLKDRKDYQACQLLKDLPANYIITDRAQMVSDLTSRIARAEGLVEEARGLPKSGGSPALKILEEALGLVPDYPGLQEEVAAVRGAYSRYQVYLESLEAAIREKNFAKAAELLKAFREVYQNDSNISRFEVAIQNRKKDMRGRENLIKNLRTISMAAAVLGVVGGGYFGYETWVLSDAGKEWDKVTRLLAEKKYAEVQTGGGVVITKLAKVRLFGGERKDEILTKLNQILQSETVKQGAVGRVMTDGAYVPVGDVSKVNSVKALMAEGASLSTAADYAGAISKFEEGLAQAGGLEASLAGKYGDELKTSLRAAQEAAVQQKIEESRSLKSAGDFNGAVAKLNESSQMAAQYGLSAEVTGQAREGAYQEIEQGRYRDMVGAGDKKLAGGRFAEAISAYEQALAFAQEKNLGVSQTAKVRESITQAKVGILAGKGDDFAKRSRWADAINSYGSAIKLHEESGLKKDLPLYRQTVDSLAKARRVAALDELRNGEREGQKFMAAAEWAKAKKTYDRQLALIDQGAYAADPEFTAFRKNAVARQAEVDEKLYLADKKDYLLGRHRALFKQAFGLGGDVAMLDPTVVLLSSAGDTLKYSLSASSFEGSGGGGVYTLYELTYAFNRKNGGWVLLDKKSGRKTSGGR